MSAENLNILLIITDQQRYDSLGCYGAGWVQTPNLDKMSREGVIFDNCYVNNPVCTPSRASMLTGKHLPGHGVYKLHDILPPEEVLITRRLQERGYRTALFGKLHVSGRIYEAEQRHPGDGFDIYEWCLEASISMDSPFNGYTRWLKEKDPKFYKRLEQERRNLLHIPRELHMTHWSAERTIDFIKGSDPARPFFCKMSVFDPHNPYEDYPLEMRKLVDEKRIPDPLISGEELKNRPYGIKQEEEHSYLGVFSKFSSEELRKMRLDYYASIALIDLEVGRVLACLEEKGIADKTMVIFTSDHGDMLGDHSLLVKGAFFYDPCVKVPLIIRWPEGFKGGKRISGLVQLHDLAATILKAAGFREQELKEIMPDSCNLVPLISGQRETIHPFVICCYRNSGINDQGVAWDPPIHATMIRDERYKLNIYHGDPVRGRKQEGQLFDMENDRDEVSNLWAKPDYNEVRFRMTESLLDWIHSRELALGSRGGTATPDPSQQLVNALK